MIVTIINIMCHCSTGEDQCKSDCITLSLSLSLQLTFNIMITQYWLMWTVLVSVNISFGSGGYEWNCTDRIQKDGGQEWFVPGMRNTTTPYVVGTAGNQLNIYHIDSLNEGCYGEVTAIEFCYRYNTTEDGEAIFNWTVLIMENDGSRSFTVCHW